MGFWTGIKHALNSTLGTSHFQPLDKIIKGQRTYAASDAVLAVLHSTSVGLLPTYQVFGSFTPKTNGSFRIGIDVFVNLRSGEQIMAVCEIYNITTNTLVTSARVISLEFGGVNNKQISFDIPVIKDNLYEIRAYSQTVAGYEPGDAYITGVKLQGQVVDLSMVDYTTS